MPGICLSGGVSLQLLPLPCSIGSSRRCKSSLVLRFVKGQFVEFQETTIGAAFFSQTLAVHDETVKFEIWDTAGQERNITQDFQEYKYLCYILNFLLPTYERARH